MKHTKAATLLLLLFLHPFVSACQVKFLLSAGEGAAFVSSKNTGATFQPVIKPNASLFLSVPLTRNLNFETGFEYIQKGYNVHSTATSDSATTNKTFKFDLAGKRTYSYVCIPLTLSFKVYENKGSDFYIGGGINYGFLIKDIFRYNSTTYIDNKFYSKYYFTYSSKIGLNEPSGVRQNIDDYILDDAIRIQARYTWLDKYTIGAFYEHSLYDINAKSDGASHTLLRYAGFTVGYVLP